MPNQPNSGEVKVQHSATPATAAKPPAYDERQDEVASIGSILSGATSKAKYKHGNANEGILSTAVDEANNGVSSRLPSIISNNHVASNHFGSTYVNAGDPL